MGDALVRQRQANEDMEIGCGGDVYVRKGLLTRWADAGMGNDITPVQCKTLS